MSSVAVVAMDIHKRFSKAVTFDTEGVVVDTQTVGHQSHDWGASGKVVQLV